MTKDDRGSCQNSHGLFVCFVVLAALTLVGPAVWAADSTPAQVLYSKGVAYERGKDYVQAIHEYKAALALSPDYFWAYKELGNCYYHLGHKDWAVVAYDRYLKAHPNDPSIQKMADLLRPRTGQGQALTNTAGSMPAPGQPLEGKSDQQIGSIADAMLASMRPPTGTEGMVAMRPAAYTPVPTPVALPVPTEHMAFGVAGFYGTYGMSTWNGLLNKDVSNASGSYEYTGTPVNGGVGLDLDFRYFFKGPWDKCSAGFFLDYMTGGGSFTTYQTSGSSSYDATGLYSFPVLFLGPQGSYTFYQPMPNLSVSASLGLGYMMLLGANLSYTTYAVVPTETSEEPQYANLSGGGFGMKLSVNADYSLARGYTLTGALGYRVTSMGDISSSVGGNLQNEESQAGLNFSGVYVSFGIAYWR